MNSPTDVDRAAAAPVLDEMRLRHLGGYPALRDKLVAEIGEYIGREPPVRLLIVGLSGGIDSALVTFLAVRAVGTAKVLPVTLPAWEDTSAISRANQVRRALGYKSPDSPKFVISIRKVVEAQVAAVTVVGEQALQLSQSLDRQSNLDRLRIGNFAARSRVAVFYDLAQAHGGRVLGTGNRTEFVQGYSAKYGTPLSYDFGVLDDLYKVDIYELARLLGVPDAVYSAVPTTGYYPGQTHESELGMSLCVQDALAYLLFERGEDPEQVISDRGFSSDSVKLMRERYVRAKHKRELQPDHIRLIRGGK